MRNSYFDGGLLSYFLNWFIATLITILTLGICFPWAVCRMIDWETRHTVINGRRLAFDGTPMQLFGNWIKWLL